MKSEVKSLVNLNTNPCKMCMPLGVATAMYGIKNAISILHGSQGCSTYIRRHMATHYNEPVDIASSSLTEQGTVYGGEVNLKKGLCNLMELYHPDVVGVCTSCLAETIGEDLDRIIDNFYKEHPEHGNVVIIPVQSAGYAGTQAEGYRKALHAIVAKIPMDTTPNDTINVITSYISPEDTRFLKKAFAEFGLQITLLPDLSENLDGGLGHGYDRLPHGGTSIDQIRHMAGASMTIELCEMESEYSPGKYLYETYGVPYQQLALPVGLRATDAFYAYLATCSTELRNNLEIVNEPEIANRPDIANGPEIGKDAQMETVDRRNLRSRYLDAMVDSHKYNSSGRVVIFGEPEFVVSSLRLCEENGIMPVVVATGSKCPKLKQMIEASVEAMAKRYLVHDYTIMDDTDFKRIEEQAKSQKANLLLGNSDGRRIEEELHIPLVRRGFPIHDRVGGQRLKMLGYEGSLQLLDEMTNALLSKVERGYRKELFDTYYKDTPIDAKNKKETQDSKKRIEEKTKEHPCFNCGANTNARIHLPVAPKCNIQCNYCVRKFDCPNESRPGVTTQVLSPQDSFLRYQEAKEKVPNLTVVGIAGPGDALANFDAVKETLTRIRAYDPKVTFCLSTNGLMLPTYAEELMKLGVTHVTVTVNAVDPKIGSKIYHHIEYMGTRYEGEAAAAILLSNQLCGLRLLVASGIICKVNIVAIKGINEDHIETVVKTMQEIGCYITNIMPMIPVKGSGLEGIDVLSNKELTKLRMQCGQSMKQMFHCKQCRADAIGTLENDQSIQFGGGCHKKKEEAAHTETVTHMEERETKAIRFAVASKSGILIDEHFGHVREFYIYEYQKNRPVFVEKRSVEKYCSGSEYCGETDDRMTKIMATIRDCQGVIAMRMGEAPKKELSQQGVYVLTTYDRIEVAVETAALAMLG